MAENKKPKSITELRKLIEEATVHPDRVSLGEHLLPRYSGANVKEDPLRTEQIQKTYKEEIEKSKEKAKDTLAYIGFMETIGKAIDGPTKKNSKERKMSSLRQLLDEANEAEKYGWQKEHIYNAPSPTSKIMRNDWWNYVDMPSANNRPS